MRVRNESFVAEASADAWAGTLAPLHLTCLAPADDAAYPGILFFTDIFGPTESSLRLMARFAGYGFTVVAPDLYRRLEPGGTALDFVADYNRAQADAGRTTVAEFDEDCDVALAAMREHARIANDVRPAAIGFCIGGLLALRAALRPAVRTTVACYPTGVHDGSLGASRDVDTLARLATIPGDVTVVFGERDPHVPPAGRAAIAAALDQNAGRHKCSTYDVEHAFMRDVGPRYDPEVSDRVFTASVERFRQAR